MAKLMATLFSIDVSRGYRYNSTDCEFCNTVATLI
jgi:hypothetical protein